MQPSEIPLKLPVAVVGGGISGRSVVALLSFLGLNEGRDFVLYDDKLAEARFKDPVKLMADFRPQSLIVSPGVPLGTPWIQEALKRGVELSSELSFSAHYLSTEKVIAVTGSLGKSTTVSLLGAALKRFSDAFFVGGNLGTPLAAYVLDLKAGKIPRAEWLVLELSSYQIENMNALPVDIAAITYLGPNHLERYPDLEAYYATKWQLLKKAKTAVVLNANGGDVSRYAEKHPLVHKISHASAKQTPLSTEQLMSARLVGAHNRDNIALAYQISQVAGWPSFSVQGLLEFKGLEHRSENAGVHRGIRFVNDSKATTMESVLTAIDSCSDPTGKQKLFVLLGGRDKKLPWQNLAALNTAHVVPVFFGECASVAQNLSRLQGRAFKNMAEAFAFAVSLAGSGDTVLLSPGGTSLDEFKNFEHRGNAFKAMVTDFASENIGEWLKRLPKTPLGFTSHSKQTADKIFVALKGDKVNGATYIPGLVQEGTACGFVVDQDFDLAPYSAHRHLFFVCKNPHEAHRELAALFRARFNGTIIGIGGSSGKTSTKEFLYQILSTKFRCFKTDKSQNGELGIPKTLEQLDSAFDYGLVEIGIDAPGDMIRHANLVKPDIALLTSIGEEHLNLLHTVENVFKEEKILFEVTHHYHGTCFAPAGDHYLARLKGHFAPLHLIDNAQGWKTPFTNLYAEQNARLAAEVALHLGMAKEDIQNALLHLQLPDGRGREILLANNRLVIADHYNANPSSLKGGLAHLVAVSRQRGANKILILGDMLDLGTETESAHRSLVEPVCAAQPDLLVLVGPEFKKLLSEFQTKGLQCVSFETSTEAAVGFDWSKNLAAGATILLKGSRGMKMELILETLQKLVP